MDIQQLKDMLKSEMAGRTIGLVASYSVKNKNAAAIKKFQDFAESLATVFTEEEPKALQEELDKLIEQQSTMYADVFEKAYSPEELKEFVDDQQ